MNKSKKQIDFDYYQSHKTEVAERVRSYYLANKERIAKYKREWYQRRKRLYK